MSLIHLHNYEAFLLDYSEGTLHANAIEELKAFILAHPELEIDLNDFDLPHLIIEEGHSFDLKNSLKKSETEVPDDELLNYLENKLSSEQKKSFEFKLSGDKDLVKDLEAYKKTILIADPNLLFEFKSALQKNEKDFILNNTLISYLENQLFSEEKIEFEKELSSNLELQKEFQLISKTILSVDESIIYPDKEALKKENRIFALFSLRTLGSMAAVILLLLGITVIYNFYTTKPVAKGNLAIKNKTELKSTPTKNAPIKNSVIKKDILDKAVKNNSFEKTLAKETVKKQVAEESQKEINTTRDEQNSIEIATDQKEQEHKINPSPSEEQKTEIALNKEPKNFIDTILSQQNYLLVTEEVPDEEESSDAKKSNQKGFWKRAVQLAKQANKLGVKSIDGQENSQNKYRLSFNSFSVEKK